uniref:Protein-glutamine gamma-glutamyltransferase 2 n=1 Tax=Cyprinus carpio TaxID=7962 RepID=A0A8C1VSS6_CYPCA
MKVDLQCEKNNTDHHTNEITVERLIIRRGQAFSLILSAELSKACVSLSGPGACEQKGTLSSCSTDPQRCSSVGKCWSVKVLSGSPSAVTLSILCPADACIGLYSLTVKSGSYTSVSALTVLFNPWSKDDGVFLESEAERQEYVMNEQGIVYQGVDEYITTTNWDFGQFEEDILNICLKLLDVNPKCLKDTAEDYSARCNPIYVSRVVSAMINSDDDKGVLMGQWDGTYIGGVLPSNWNSSVDILRRWIKYDCYPVKFGQCWVFAAVMCTVLRCLGIPCRVVTNYQSAHDTDQNLVIDEYFSDYESDVTRHVTALNYHVWVEGWMKRPDLSQDSFYDGWQVLDPTPQERSSGSYCCGPAPVKAILEGHTDVKYDIPFVYGEVNADKITWLVMANGSKKKILSDTKTVGQKISTKAVGSDSRQDITDQYKHPEGSVNERAVYDEAVKRVTGLIESQTPRPSVQMKLSLDGEPLNGADIRLKLLVKSENSKAQDLTLKMSAQVMRYTGTPAADVWKCDQLKYTVILQSLNDEVFVFGSTVELGPGQRITLRVTFKPYRLGPKKLVANFDCSTFRDIKASVDVNVRPAATRLGFLSFRR